MSVSLEQLQCYLVGGAVRDELLGRASPDRDWVVVGATQEQLLALDFVQVGRDFPVFLHPQSKQEYALARTERKRGRGHKGFMVDASPDVTLEQDLARRDLTINAIAKAANGELIDPYNGQQDIKDGVLRHVSEAFVEDPLRVFRVARFAAQLPGFEVAEQTLTLMQSMARDGELQTLSPERVWQEFEKALGAPNPQRWFQVLSACDSLDAWQPELHRPELQTTDAQIFVAGTSVQRFALLPLTLTSLQTLTKRLRAPKSYIQLAADRIQYGELIASYPWQKNQAEALHRAFNDLQVLHEGARLKRLIMLLRPDLSEAESQHLEDLRDGLRGVELPPDHGMVGKDYGEALQLRRIAWLQNYLAR